MPSYDVKTNPDGTVSINGFTFPAGTVPAFPPAGRTRADGLSDQVARTMRNTATIEAGRHPFGGPLRQPAGETCGSCLHCVERRYHAQSCHWKCGRMRDRWTKGPGTDLRKKWPACASWERNGPEPPPPPPEPDPLAPAIAAPADGPGNAPALGGRHDG